MNKKRCGLRGRGQERRAVSRGGIVLSSIISPFLVYSIILKLHNVPTSHPCSPKVTYCYSLGRKQINKFTPINLTSLHVCLQVGSRDFCFFDVSGLVQATGRGWGISFLLAGLLLFHPHYSGVMLVSSLHGSLTSGGQLMVLLPAIFSLPIAGDLPDQDSTR